MPVTVAVAVGLRNQLAFGGKTIPNKVDAFVWLDGTISGNNFVDKISGRLFPVTNKDFPAGWTKGFPYKSAATFSAPVGDAALIAADVNNFFYTAGVPNQIPVISCFQDVDYAHRLFFRHIDQSVDIDTDVETYEPRVAEMVLYNTAATGGDLTARNLYFKVPAKLTSGIREVGAGKTYPSSITDAITASSSTDTIYVYSGTYTMTAAITKPFKIQCIGNVNITISSPISSVNTNNYTIKGANITSTSGIFAPYQLSPLSVLTIDFCKIISPTVLVNNTVGNHEVIIKNSYINGFINAGNKFTLDTVLVKDYPSSANRCILSSASLFTAKNIRRIKGASATFSEMIHSTTGGNYSIVGGDYENGILNFIGDYSGKTINVNGVSCSNNLSGSLYYIIVNSSTNNSSITISKNKFIGGNLLISKAATIAFNDNIINRQLTNPNAAISLYSTSGLSFNRNITDGAISLLDNTSISSNENTFYVDQLSSIVGSNTNAIDLYFSNNKVNFSISTSLIFKYVKGTVTGNTFEDPTGLGFSVAFDNTTVNYNPLNLSYNVFKLRSQTFNGVMIANSGAYSVINVVGNDFYMPNYYGNTIQDVHLLLTYDSVIKANLNRIYNCTIGFVSKAVANITSSNYVEVNNNLYIECKKPHYVRQAPYTRFHHNILINKTVVPTQIGYYDNNADAGGNVASSNCQFADNKISAPAGGIMNRFYDTSRVGFISDRNQIFGNLNCILEDSSVKTLSQWVALGYDTNSTFTDPYPNETPTEPIPI